MNISLHQLESQYNYLSVYNFVVHVSFETFFNTDKKYIQNVAIIAIMIMMEKERMRRRERRWKKNWLCIFLIFLRPFARRGREAASEAIVRFSRLSSLFNVVYRHVPKIVYMPAVSRRKCVWRA